MLFAWSACADLDRWCLGKWLPIQKVCHCLINPLTPHFYLAYASLNTLYLHFWADSKTEPKCTFSLCRQTCWLNNTHSLMSMHSQHSRLANSCLEPRKLSLPEMNPPTRWEFFKAVHAVEVRVGLACAKHILLPILVVAMSTAPCWWAHPSPSVLLFLQMQNPCANMQRLCTQYDVTKSTLYRV